MEAFTNNVSKSAIGKDPVFFTSMPSNTLAACRLASVSGMFTSSNFSADDDFIPDLFGSCLLVFPKVNPDFGAAADISPNVNGFVSAEFDFDELAKPNEKPPLPEVTAFVDAVLDPPKANVPVFDVDAPKVGIDDVLLTKVGEDISDFSLLLLFESDLADIKGLDAFEAIGAFDPLDKLASFLVDEVKGFGALLDIGG